MTEKKKAAPKKSDLEKKVEYLEAAIEMICANNGMVNRLATLKKESSQLPDGS